MQVEIFLVCVDFILFTENKMANETRREFYGRCTQRFQRYIIMIKCDVTKFRSTMQQDPKPVFFSSLLSLFSR